MILVTHFYLFMSAFLASAIMIPPVSRIAVRIGGVDRPDERKVHCNEVPRLGGISIFLSFLVSLIVFTDVDHVTRGFLAGSLVIFLTGLIDDLIAIPPCHKFAGEILAAVVGLSVGGIWLDSIGNLFGLGEITLGVMSKPFTVFAVVGVMNAINLIDGLDGLAGGVSAIACLAFGALACWSGNTILTLLAAALLGSLVGFLWHNSYPARIFMGDSGSLFLGYCMGFFSIMLVNVSHARISPMIPVIILGVPLIDTLVVMVNRVRKGGKVFAPDRTHIHHRLLDLGFGHKLTVLVVYGLSWILAFSALLLRDLRDYTLAPLLVATAALFYLLVHFLFQLEAVKRLKLTTSNQPIRETSTYRKLVGLTGNLLRLIKYLLIVIIMFSMAVPKVESRAVAIFSVLLLVMSFVLLFMKSEWSNLFLQAVLYCSGAFILFVMENFGRDVSIFSLPLPSIIKGLFLVLLIVEGAKVFVRKRTKLLLRSPFEYLLFFLILSVPLLPAELTSSFHLMTVVGESVILFVAYKLILMRRAAKNRKLIAVTTLALLVFSVKHFSAF